MDRFRVYYGGTGQFMPAESLQEARAIVRTSRRLAKLYDQYEPRMSIAELDRWTGAWETIWAESKEEV